MLTQYNSLKKASLVLPTLLVLLLVCTQIAQAQTTSFTYQGKLVDNGNLANGTFDLQVKLFDTVTVGTGTQQGSTVTVSNVTVTNGIFTVSLDFGVCPSCFNGAARFLEIAVKPSSGSSFTTLSPRQPVTATPYALKTTNLTFNGAFNDGINIFTASNTFTGERAGINTAPDPDPANSIGKFNAFYGAGTGQANILGDSNSFFGAQAGQVNSSGSGNSFYGNQAGFNNNSGTNNTFVGRIAGYNNLSSFNTFIGVGADFNGSNPSGDGNTLLGAFTHVTSGVTNGTAIGLNTTVTQSNSLVLGNNANVGIGTTAPTFKLEVIDASNTGLHVQNNTTGGTVASFGRFGNFLIDSAVNGGRMTVLENGNVGIGATSPSFKLHLIDSSNTGLRVQTNTAGGTVASFGGAGAFQIDTNGVAGGRFTVLENGNIGIGTNNPLQKFHVSGTGVIRALVNSDSNAGFGLALSNQQKWSVATVTGGNFQIFNETLGSNAFWIDSATNNVGIGTTTTNARLSVDAASSNGLRVQVAVAGGNVASFGGFGEFQIDSLTGLAGGRLKVKENGTVMINNPPSDGNPITGDTEKLSVNGYIRAYVPPVGVGIPVCQEPTSSRLVLCAVSSRRYKKNIQDFNEGLSLISQLRPVSFNWKANDQKDFGLVAEDVAEITPFLTFSNAKGEVEGVKYDRISVVAINAIKEQQAQITSQQAQLKQQTEQIQSLQHLVDQQQQLFLRQQQQLAALQRRLGSSHRKSHTRR